MKKTIYLICNAHLDPVWLWEWEEGLAEALSTFRIAADFCEEYDGFIFNHNESLLYEWIEEYDFDLFQRIQKLVRQGKWHIMGGWYVQADCNIPSGESIVRQILTAKTYFKDKFEVEPTVAASLDPFGHSKGLVQILNKSGYTGYLFCRPSIQTLGLNSPDFVWQGYNNSEILAHLATEHYDSPIGTAHQKIRNWIKNNPDEEIGMILWGIGNHGGGPSKEDLDKIEGLKKEFPQYEIIHSTPQTYWEVLHEVYTSKHKPTPKLHPQHGGGLGRGQLVTFDTFSNSLTPFAVGCYTSMAEVKQLHRKLENLYFSTERMVCNLYIQKQQEYPYSLFQTALKNLLFCEFHDVLPGTSISEVETYVVQRLNHGLQIMTEIRSKAFFKMISGFQPCKSGEFPVFVYNPLPYDSEETIVCEFQPQNPNFDKETFWIPEVYDENGDELTCQLEKPGCNILADQRKRVVFTTRLKASSMHRYSCYLTTVPIQHVKTNVDQKFVFGNDKFQLEIDRDNGLIKRYVVDGEDYLQEEAFCPVVMNDTADSWGMRVLNFTDLAGKFKLLTPKESAEFAGVSSETIDPVRVVANGEIRTVVEALLGYKNSRIAIRYVIPKDGTEIGIEIHTYWFEKDKFLKLSVPTRIKNAICLGQDMFGVKEFEDSTDEQVAQQWVGLFSNHNKALTIINDRIYGFDHQDNELRLSLLRSPAYAGHPVKGQKIIVRQDRFEPRIDQGYRLFKFWMKAGDKKERIENIQKESQIKNEGILSVAANPAGKKINIEPGIQINDPAVQLVALKKSERDDTIVIRLFESSGKKREATITVPYIDKEFDVTLNPFELKTFRLSIENKNWIEVDLIERPI